MAAWSRIGITFLIQILLVPVYLSRWDSKTYGIWLAIQALVSLLQLLDLGHQQFLRNEFLRIGNQRIRQLQITLWSSIPIALSLGAIEFSITLLLYHLGFLTYLLGSEPHLSQSAGLIVLFSILVWTFTGSVLGIATQALSPLGYFPRFSWWGVGMIVFTNICPIISVLVGNSFFETGIIWVVSIFIVNIPLGMETWRLLVKEKLHPVTINLKLGLKNFRDSQILTLKTLLEMIRQQGFRILLVPLSGESGMVAFVTMRTGANVAIQGLATITNPLLPELMRFLNQRDQKRSGMSFSIIWLAIISIIAPSVILLQVFVGPFFEIWTRGKVTFDPMLFSMLSMGVLILGIAQPAVAIIQGNNLLRAQLRISILSSFLAVAGLFFFINVIGIRGAALAILIAEIASAICYIWEGKRWLEEHSMRWPTIEFRWVLVSLMVTTVSMVAIILWPMFHKEFAISGIAAQMFCVFKYWILLSSESRLRALNLILPFLPVALRRKIER